MRTPWGDSDYEREYADGITFYGTPSHGGFHLSVERELELDMKLAAVGLTAREARMGYPKSWYEEDCSALAVVWAWYPLFEDDSNQLASHEETFAMLEYWCRKGGG